MRARRLRRNSRARAPRAGPIGARRALAAVPRDPVRSPPRGCHAAGWPRRIGRRFGQLFRRERWGYSVGRCLTVMAHWRCVAKGDVCSGRHRWAHVRRCPWGERASQQSAAGSCPLYFFPGRPLEVPPHRAKLALCRCKRVCAARIVWGCTTERVELQRPCLRRQSSAETIVFH